MGAVGRFMMGYVGRVGCVLEDGKIYQLSRVEKWEWAVSDLLVNDLLPAHEGNRKRRER
jgi:hypothetical protein